MQGIGIFYGSSTMNTETVASHIKNEFGADVCKTFDVANAKTSDVEQFSNLIFGSSTIGVGDLQDDFEYFISKLEKMDLAGKKIALFGCGDQECYPDSFVDAMGIIYESIKDKGCDLIGKVALEGYDHDDSRAEVDDQFVGLPIDEDNQDELTDERIKAWVSQLKEEFA